MPALKHFQTMARCSRRVRKTLSLGAFAGVCMTLGCARLPPGQNGLSGRRIHVVMTFADAIQPNFYYYFLINRYGPTGTTSAHGPVPVLGAVTGYNSLGNGFATGSPTGSTGTISGVPDYGITDFVLYHTPQPNGGIGLYHFTQDPNTQQYPGNPSSPLNPILPTQSDTSASAANTLQFDIDMQQLVTDVTTTDAKNQEARNIQFLQINIIATNVIPTDPNYNGIKQVDCFGDSRDTNQLGSSFITIRLDQANTYTSSQSLGVTLSPEPSSDDVYNGPNPSIDLRSWSVTVQPSS